MPDFLPLFPHRHSRSFGNDLSVFSPLRYALGYEGDSFVVSLCSTIRLYSVALSVLDGATSISSPFFYGFVGFFLLLFFNYSSFFRIFVGQNRKCFLITIKNKDYL